MKSLLDLVLVRSIIVKAYDQVFKLHHVAKGVVGKISSGGNGKTEK